MLLVIELGSDVMQNIVCNTKSIIFVTVITIPCKTIRKKKKNDNKKKVMQKFLEFFYHLTWYMMAKVKSQRNCINCFLFLLYDCPM